ncbi:ABC transporter ATP-binding protein [Paenibacillaceae bacterium WGS1546]|uniref:ABC transporter ATP-binding protein n=1 Tax=Cohnella sp. WGS1546 TaxID=3366810 RepID=UPI00372D3905
MSEAAPAILKLTNVVKQYRVGRLGAGQKIRAVDGVNLAVKKGEIFGIAGESGCGKSTIAKMISNLLDVSEGEIQLEDCPAKFRNREELMDYRRKVQMIFQDPYSSCNPKKTVRHSVLMPLKSLAKLNGEEMNRKFKIVMDWVGIPERLHDAYPHELSGGQLQRVAIARALIIDPLVLVADEPIAALDVSIQSQILNLLTELQAKIGLTILFISHDLRVVHKFTERTAIMYLGNIVETGPTDDLFGRPAHPYTQALTRSIPRLDAEEGSRLEGLSGEVPSLYDIPAGCPFQTRCEYKMERCAREKPSLAPIGDGSRMVACHYPIGGE